MTKARARTAGSRWLHLHALSVLAVAQPLYDQLGRNPTFFVAHRASDTSIWILGIALFLIPGLICGAISIGVSAMHRRLGWVLHCVLIGALGAVVLLPAWNRAFDHRVAFSLGAAAASGLVVGGIYAGVAKLRPFFTYIGAFTVVIFGLFAFASEASALLFEKDINAIGQGGNETPVVLIVFDEFPLVSILEPDLSIDAAKAPNLAAWVEEDVTWYRNATSTSWSTRWAVPGILTGNQVESSTVPVASQYPQNLFTVLAPSHEVTAVEAITRMCPDSICDGARSALPEPSEPGSIVQDVRVLYLHTLLPRSLANRWLPSITDRWTGFEDDTAETEVDRSENSGGIGDAESSWREADLDGDQADRFATFLDAIDANTGPTFSYLHMIVPHVPWKHLPDGTEYDGGSVVGFKEGGIEWDDDQTLIDEGIQRHLLSATFTDSLIGDMLEQLRSADNYDETMVIVVSDHGQAFVPSINRRRGAEGNIDELATVPLFVKYPGQTQAATIDDPVEIIDVFATVTDVLEVEIAEDVDATSLLDLDGDRRDRSIRRGGSVFPIGDTVDLLPAIERLIRVVPAGVSPDQRWGLVETHELIGTAVADFTIAGTDADFELTLRSSGRFRDVDPTAGSLPLRVSASAKDGEGDGEVVLFALNGTIATSAKIVDDRAHALLDPSLLMPGRNTVETYLYRGGTLTPITLR